MTTQFLAASLLAASGDYPAAMGKWRQEYEARLKADDGWLSVAGLFWLHEGSNRVGSDPASDIVLPKSAPRNAGVIEFHAEFHAGHARFRGKELKADVDIEKIGNLQLQVIKRGERYGVRLRDPDSAARRNFSALQWFPVNEKYRVKAKFVPNEPPKMIPITNILGDTEPEKCPGYVEFTLEGHSYRLEPVIEEPNELFFIFRDLTSERESYGSGRFLKSEMPKNGAVILDFNQAYNPPCAFTAFATCPLPPRQNRLSLRIEAGEKRYGKH
ncbi:MAG: DUF1684 domain-containing protein [Acidobacteriota bacterium]|nr:DUF1684 domain-containing protein [Acidobacteriota bacterium]